MTEEVIGILEDGTSVISIRTDEECYRRDSKKVIRYTCPHCGKHIRISIKGEQE